MANKIADLLVSLGLDTKGFEGGLKKSGKGIESLKKGLKVGVAAAGVAAGAAIAFAAKEAIQYEKSLGDLVTTLKTVKGASVDTFKAMVKESSRLQDLTGIGDSDILDGMRRFTDVTGDANAALQNSAVIADFATKNKMRLADAALILGRAYNGDIEMLKRYGVQLKEASTGQDALNQISAKFKGAAEGNLKTVSGQWADLKNIFSDIGKIFGAYLLPLISDGLTFLRNAFKALRESGAIQWIGREMTYQARVVVPAYIKTLSNIGKVFKVGIVGMVKEWQANAQLLHDEFSKQIADIESMDVTWNKYTAYVNENTDAIEDNTTKTNQWEKALNNAKDTAMSYGSVAASVLSSTVSSVLDATKTLNEKMADVLKSGLIAVLDIIGLQIKAQIAALTATTAATFGAAAPQLGIAAAQLAVLEGLKAAVGTISLAEGGIVSAPTSAIVGDSTSPEVVAPLHKLEPMITRAVNNSTSNKINIVINSNGLDNAADIVRKQIAPELDRYLKKRGGGFYGA